jgi:hypothetical protein
MAKFYQEEFMKFVTIKNTKKNQVYSIKIDGETVVIYIFDSVKQGFIRAIQINRSYLLRRLVNKN